MLIGKVGLNTIANDVQTQGYGAAHKASMESRENLSVSNFGDETKAGSSKFQQSNEETSEQGQKVVAEKMKDETQTREDFSTKMSYQKNATLAAIKTNTLDISQ